MSTLEPQKNDPPLFIAMVIGAILLCLSTITIAVLILSYFGRTLEIESEIDPNDKKRKQLIGFSWLSIILSVLLGGAFLFNSIDIEMPISIGLFFLITISVNGLILSYIQSNEKIDVTDWRRKFLIIVSYLIIFIVLGFLAGSGVSYFPLY